MRKRTKQIKIWLDEKEKNKLDRLVEKSMLSMSEYLRQCCIGKDKVVFIDSVEVANIKNEINRIGNNINQITRLANAKKSVEPIYIEKLNNIMAALRTEVNEQLNNLVK